MAGTIEVGRRVRVVEAWKASFADPLRLAQGERVELGKRDAEWPGWVWCTNAEGKGGWVPDSYLEGNRVRQDYDAVELDVEAGDVLQVEAIESGWVWGVTEEGRRGWVPVKCLD